MSFLGLKKKKNHTNNFKFFFWLQYDFQCNMFNPRMKPNSLPMQCHKIHVAKSKHVTQTENQPETTMAVTNIKPESELQIQVLET